MKCRLGCFFQARKTNSLLQITNKSSFVSESVSLTFLAYITFIYFINMHELVAQLAAWWNTIIYATVSQRSG
jgi:hypothetical protein